MYKREFYNFRNALNPTIDYEHLPLKLSQKIYFSSKHEMVKWHRVKDEASPLSEGVLQEIYISSLERKP